MTDINEIKTVATFTANAYGETKVEIRGYTLNRTIESSTGANIEVYVNDETMKVIIAAAGTDIESARDIADDLALLAVGITVQAVAINSAINDAALEYPDYTIVAGGHSLAGAGVQAASSNPNLTQAYAFNSPGLFGVTANLAGIMDLPASNVQLIFSNPESWSAVDAAIHNLGTHMSNGTPIYFQGDGHSMGPLAESINSEKYKFDPSGNKNIGPYISPIDRAIANLREEFSSIPDDYVGAKLYAELSEYVENYSFGGSGSAEVWLNNLLEDPSFRADMASLEIYYAEMLPDGPEDTPKKTTPNKNDKDPDPDPTVEEVPEPTDTTAPAPGETWVDSGGGTNVQDSPTIRGHGQQAPVILDLDGDGIELAFGEDIYFDTDGDGFAEQTSWAAADDGFLVRDLGMDGVIDQAEELAFAAGDPEGDTDLEALARFDQVENGGNGDGVLSAADAIWNELKVWQDLDQDGKTEGDGTELKTLADWGISEIGLAIVAKTNIMENRNIK